MTDDQLFKDLDFIESLGLPYCLANNTLLSIYRDKTTFPQPQRECVILMWAKDREFIRTHAKRTLDVDAVTKLGNINMEGQIAICFMNEINGKILINSWWDYFLSFDKNVIVPFGYLDYKGRTIPIPREPDRYLEVFYGDWQTPIPPEKWNWVRGPHVFHAHTLDEASRHD